MDVTNTKLKIALDDKLKEIYTKNQEDGYTLKYDKWSFKNKNGNIDSAYCADKCLKYLNNIFAENKKFSTVQDFSIIRNGYGCYNLQLIKDNYEKNHSHSICVNISLSIPIFHIHVLHLERQPSNFPKWNGLPYRDKKLEIVNYKDDIHNIRNLLISNLGLIEIPDSLIEEKISWLYTEDISLGDFTYYKAFFQREFYTR